MLFKASTAIQFLIAVTCYRVEALRSKCRVILPISPYRTLSITKDRFLNQRIRNSVSLMTNRESSDSETDNKLNYFVPIFVGVWAVGYTVLAYLETQGGGLGDVGGIVGASLVVILMVSLFAAAAWESFKPE